MPSMTCARERSDVPMGGPALERAGQATDDEDQAGTAEFAGLIHGAEIVRHCGRETGFIGSGEHAATAVSG